MYALASFNGTRENNLIAYLLIMVDDFGMEIDPRYADVIVKRYEDYTGKKAILESAA